MFDTYFIILLFSIEKITKHCILHLVTPYNYVYYFVKGKVMFQQLKSVQHELHG